MLPKESERKSIDPELLKEDLVTVQRILPKDAPLADRLEESRI